MHLTSNFTKIQTNIQSNTFHARHCSSRISNTYTYDTNSRSLKRNSTIISSLPFLILETERRYEKLYKQYFTECESVPAHRMGRVLHTGRVNARFPLYASRSGFLSIAKPTPGSKGTFSARVSGGNLSCEFHGYRFDRPDVPTAISRRETLMAATS